MFHLRRLQRIATSPLRALPGFLIVGAQKCATTSLYDFICEHPKVKPAETKEVHYFDWRLNMGDAWYRSHFPFRRQGCITGESTPSLLWSTPSLPDIKRLLPNVKIIFVLREPAERAVSHYYHNVRASREKRPLEEALFAEESLRSADGLTPRTREYVRHLHFSYISRSRYDEQLAALEKYYPLQDCLGLPFSCVANLNSTNRKAIFSFLNLPDHPIERLTPKNKGIPKQSDAVRRIMPQLQEHLEASRTATLERMGWDHF